MIEMWDESIGITRICKLPKHDKVIIGRDFGGIFEDGHVYSFKKICGEIIVTDLGITSLSDSGHDFPNLFSKIEDIMVKSNKYIITKEELESFGK